MMNYKNYYGDAAMTIAIGTYQEKRTLFDDADDWCAGMNWFESPLG